MAIQTRIIDVTSKPAPASVINGESADAFEIE